MKPEKGSILIVTLWVLAILFLLAIGLAYRVGLDLHMTRYARDRLKTLYLTKAGIEWATSLLVQDASLNEVDSYQEPWHHDETLFKEKVFGGGFFTLSYVLPDSEGREIRYGMQDEESRIPLNIAKPEVLANTPGFDASLVISIRAWRGDEDLTPEQIASEEEYYLSLPNPYMMKGSPFETVEELLLVRGMTPDLYEEVQDLFTVYGSGKVNLNTATVGTLRLLGLDEDIARRISEGRKGNDQIDGTEDDFVLETVSDLVSMEFGGYLRLDQDQQLALTNFLTAQQEMLAVQSQSFRMEVEGQLQEGRVGKRIEVVVDRSSGRGSIRYWHED